MNHVKKWCCSFRFRRRGQSNLWELDAETRYGVPQESTGEPGTKLAQHNDKLEWIDVVFATSPEDDFDEHYDRAEKNAVSLFQQRHPESDLVS